MKTVCAIDNFSCIADKAMDNPLHMIGLICGVFVVVSVIRFVFMD